MYVSGNVNTPSSRSNRLRRTHESTTVVPNQPLQHLDQWDDFLEGRYKEGKSEEEFRQYDATATPGVAEFYRLNHENMTVDYVLAKEEDTSLFGRGKRQSGKPPNSLIRWSTTAIRIPI